MSPFDIHQRPHPQSDVMLIIKNHAIPILPLQLLLAHDIEIICWKFMYRYKGLYEKFLEFTSKS